MKEYLDRVGKNDFKKVSDIFIKILCNASIFRQEVIELLDISVSNDKWRRIRNDESLKPRGNTPLIKIYQIESRNGMKS